MNKICRLLNSPIDNCFQSCFNDTMMIAQGDQYGRHDDTKR